MYLCVQEVLKIFLKKDTQNNDDVVASGSGDGEIIDDDEGEDDSEVLPTRAAPQANKPVREDDSNAGRALC